MQFGFTLKPDHTIERTLALTRQAEAAGFEYGWLFDSHVLWRDPYPLLTLMAQATTTTAPRHLRHQPGHARAHRHGVGARRPQRALRRAHGPGHRARRLRPARPGQAADVDEGPRAGGPRHPGAGRGPRRSSTRARCSSFPWTPGTDAAGLDRRLRAGGAQAHRADRRRGDAPDRRPGPDPLVRLAGARLRGAEAGRDPDRGPGDGRGAGARRRPRRRPRPDALVPGARGNHVVDLVNKYPREDLPEELTGYVRDREGYDYLHHAEVGSSNASFVTDEIVDRFCLVGSVGAAHRAAARRWPRPASTSSTST